MAAVAPPRAPDAGGGRGGGGGVDNTSFHGVARNALAGMTGGAISDVLLHPVDTVRARQQAHRGHAVSFLSEAAHLQRRHGWRGFYRGVGATSINVPSHGIYFAGYEYFRDRLAEAAGPQRGAAAQTAVHIVAGMLAELCASATGTPYDVVKQKAQVMRSATVVPDLLPSHSPFLGTVPPHLHKGVSSWSIAQGIWRAEGVRGFYRGYLASVLTWCPFTSAYFATYEPVKELTVRALGRREADIHFAWFIIAGCAAGTVATVLTNPIDVVRTRLQVQGKGGLVVTPELQQLGGQYTGVFDAFRKIHALEGLAGFAKGMGARMLWITPWTATGIVAYEGCKRVALS